MRSRLFDLAGGASPAPTPALGLFGHLVTRPLREQHGSVFRRSREPAHELPLDRDDVLAIFGSLADIYAGILEILRILGEENDEEAAQDES
jgi:hypothetical protein